jgi:hypothetical protein
MSDQNAAPSAMSDANDAQKSLDQMKVFMELRGLQPNTVYTFALCARRFLAQGTFTFDTRLPGNRNSGHEFGTKLSEQEKQDLVAFLKSL